MLEVIEYYLGEMEDAFARENLQLCEVRVSDAGVNFIGLESVDGFASQRYNPASWLHNSLHPNARGHQAMLDVLDNWLKRSAVMLLSGSGVRRAAVLCSSRARCGRMNRTRGKTFADEHDRLTLVALPNQVKALRGNRNTRSRAKPVP